MLRQIFTCGRINYTPNVLQQPAIIRYQSSHASSNSKNLYILKFNSRFKYILKQLCESSLERCKDLSICLNKGFHAMSIIAARQCAAVLAQRLRRTTQMLQLYKQIYSKNSLDRMVDGIKKGLDLKKKTKPLYVLFSAVIFSWEHESITDDELERLMKDMEQLQLDNDQKETTKEEPKRTANREPITNNGDHKSVATDQSNEMKWELLIDKKDFKVWRKGVPDSYLYQYKVLGSYHDIPARAFYSVQVDLDYRRRWDKLIEHLSIVDRDEKSGAEVVHWISKFPYPMYSREYVYIRRHVVNEEHNMMLLVNKAVHHPRCPMQEDKYVRVETYDTQMVIHPHTTFDENGFDYVLTYFDDPKAAFPSFAYNWMAKTGVPDFVDKVHNAAKELHQRKRPCMTQPCNCTQYHTQPNLNSM